MFCYNILNLEYVHTSNLLLLFLLFVYKTVICIFKNLFTGCKVVPFGSIVTGLGIKTSDADCYIDIPDQFRHPKEIFVVKAKAIFNSHPDIFQQVFMIPQAKVPIVKFYHVPTKTYCDVNFKSPSGAHNSELIGCLMCCHPRILHFAVLVKYWSRVHGLTGTNLFPNYALILLIIFYLQQIKMVPTVERLQRSCEPDFVDNWNTNFVNDMSMINICTDDLTTYDLLGGFFKFYRDFDFDLYIVSPFVGYAVKRELFTTLKSVPNEFQLYKNNVTNNHCHLLKIDTPFCIQDVFDHSRNCAGVVPPRIVNKLKQNIHLAAQIYEETSKNDCRAFLKDLFMVKIDSPKKKKPLKTKHRNVTSTLRGINAKRRFGSVHRHGFKMSKVLEHVHPRLTTQHLRIHKFNDNN